MRQTTTALAALLAVLLVASAARSQSTGVDLSLDQFIVQPLVGCGPRSLSAVITNRGTTALPAPFLLPVMYTVDDGVHAPTAGQGVAFSFTAIQPNQPITVTFPVTLTLTNPLPHLISAQLIIVGDTNPSNNSVTSLVSGTPSVTSFPWTESFDGLGWNGAGAGSAVPPPCWTNVQGENLGGIGSDWLFRTGPTSTGGTGPSGGITAGLNDFYGFCEDTGSSHSSTEILTPYLDLSGLPGAELRFWVHSVHASGGGQGENQLHVDLLTFPGEQTFTDITTPIGHVAGGWHEVTINLNSWIGGLVQIRFRAEMDGATGADLHDIAIDGISVDQSQGVDLTVASIDSPSAGVQTTCSSGSPVVITVLNLGPADLNTGTNLPISYSYDDGSGQAVTISETRQITSPISAGSTFTHAFSTPLTIAPLTAITMSATVSLPYDIDPLNDTLAGHQHTNAGAPAVAAFPFIEDFDLTNWNGTGFGTTSTPGTCWLNIQNENNAALHGDWYFASGSVGSPLTGPDGDHTSSFGGYAYAKVDATAVPHSTSLVSPAFDLSSLSRPVVSFWVHSLRSNGIAAQLHIDLLHGSSNALLQSNIINPIGDLGTTSYHPFFIAIDQATHGNNVRLQFRFEAPSGAALHDIAIDDFVVREVLGERATAGLAEFDISNATDAFGFPVDSWIGGPFQSLLPVGSPMHLTVVAPAWSGCLLLSGPLNPGIRQYPGIGQLDLGIPPVFPSPSGVTILIDGFSGGSLLDLLFNTGSTGTLTLDLNLNLPAGSNFPLQVAVANGGTGVLTLTNTVVLSTL